MHTRRLKPADAKTFPALRLAALQEAPAAFGSSYDEEKDFQSSTIEQRLAEKSDSGPFGFRIPLASLIQPIARTGKTVHPS